MKKTSLLFTLFTVFTGFTTFSQQMEKGCTVSTVTIETTPEPSTLPEIENYDGTFQFQVPVNDAFNFTTALLDRVASERLQDEDVLLDLGNGRSVLILSKDKINDPAFVPFATPYSFD